MIAAAIPVKRLSEAKSRLSARLSPAERSALALTLLSRVVGALQGSGRVTRIAIAGPQPEIAKGLGTDWLPDRGGLNPTLRGAVEWAQGLRADALLILPCDLPFLDVTDIRLLLDGRADAPGASVVAAQDGGTGALLLAPPGIIAPAFGPDSFRRHVELARRTGIAVQQVAIPGFGFDLDTVQDLEKAQSSLFSLPLGPTTE